MSTWRATLSSLFGARGRVATIDSARSGPPPSPLAPVDLTDSNQVARVMEVAARIGDILLSSGTANRDCRTQMHNVTTAYGLHYIHIDITKNTITLYTTMGAEGQWHPITVFRVSRGIDTNFSQLSEVDRLIRSIRAGATSLDQAEKILDDLRDRPQEYGMKYAIWGWGLLGAAVAITLGGRLISIVTAFILCMVIIAVNTIVGRNGLPVFFQQILGGIIATLPAAVTYTFAGSLGIPISPSQIIASGIVVLVAGLSLVQSLQDGIMGASVTGAARFFDTMLHTAGIVAGVALGIRLAEFLAMPLPPLPTQAPENFASAVVKIIGGALISMGFAIAMYAERSAILISGLSALMGMSFYHLVFMPAGLGDVTSAFFTSTIIGLAGGLLARRYLVPPVIIAISGITPMLPGLMLYRSMYAMLNDQLLVGFTTLFIALAIAGALAAGVVLGEWLAYKLRRPAPFRPYTAFRRARDSRRVRRPPSR